MEDRDKRIEELEENVAELMARYAAVLGVLQVLVLRLDDATFRAVIELLDFPVPPGMGPAATRKGDHFFSEFSEHLLSLRKRMYGEEDGEGGAQ